MLLALIVSFPALAPALANHLKRFVTAPISTFQYDTAMDVRAPLPLVTAAKTLALCIKVCWTMTVDNKPTWPLTTFY